MPFKDRFQDYDDLDEYDLPRIKNLPSRRQQGRREYPSQKFKRLPHEVQAEISAQRDRENEFEFTYNASRHERVWIEDSLGGFFEQRWIDDILRLVKGGKEASVYHCTAGPNLQAPWLAAKVYRPRRFRNLKNDHLYREGRLDLDENGHVINDTRMLHAIKKRTEFGRELMHTSWIEHEVKIMQTLEAAGADVPRQYASGSNAILMEYIGGEEMAAPTLNSLTLDPDEAYPLFKRLLRNIDIMLDNRIIHGDLSAYNILYWEGQFTLIDFPQAIDPEINRSAFQIFQRDVTRVCEYFRAQGIRANPRRLAAGLWKAHGYRLGPEVDPGLLNPDDEGDIEYWNRFAS